MTIISNDPELWPLISGHRVYSYFVVASSAAVVYDWGKQKWCSWMKSLVSNVPILV
ncbi:hypothetical protein AZE42_12063 [Rhizopogon vesiculosus]|uniref:Uncharacterized protein n=1 Tax=Rhizopogon vesiculosus TaxID=180088 RepID=A0A1J8PVJ4_9AGAM|nr:hypothetical protein AZE42_12063 [Rhizopogon vesiculosus]